MRLKPLQDWALIQRVEPEERTAGGIIIPDSAKDKPTEGIVLAIGPGKYVIEKGKEKEKKKKFIPTVLKPGQRVMYGKYSAREFEVDKEPVILVREEDVLGTIEETTMAKRQTFEIAEKNEKPLAVRKESGVMNVAPPSEGKKPFFKKPAIKKETVSKTSAKAPKKKTTPAKKETPKAAQKTAVRKTVTKKTAEKRVAEKGPKKVAVTKKTKVIAKNVTAKKTATKKPAQKKTVKKVVKKTVQKKAVTAKKQAPKKTAAKTKKKAKK